MGMIAKAWEWLNGPAQFDADPAPRPIADVLLEMNSRGLLPKAGRAEALSVPAVLRARNIICGPATLPLIQRDIERKVRRLPLLEQIDPNVANVVTLAQTLEDLLFEAVSWWRITEFGSDGYPTYAEHVDFAHVHVQDPNNPSPLPGGYDPRGGVIYMYGTPVPYSQVIRFDSPNPGLLSAGGRAVRRALLLDTTSALYANNPRPMDYFTPNEDADPTTDEDVAALLAAWNRARKLASTAYVPAALKYNTVDSPTPVELQLAEQQRKATLDIANATGLDPEDLGVSTTSRTYQNGVDRRQDRINDTLSPYMAAIQQRLSMPDVTKRGYLVAFDLDAYLRADPLTRATVYEKAGVTSWLTDDEVREEEGLPALTPAQRASMTPADPQPAKPAGNVIPIRRTAANMAGDADEGLAFAMDVQPLAAHVDVERRIIEGPVVPYGVDKVAWKGGVRWRFQRGSLVIPRELHRNKALRDHDNSQPLGKLVFAEDREDHMWARYKITEGPDGDRALREAMDQIRDGFSVGVEINDAAPDPQNQGVYLVAVGGAAWRETSLLAVPAFDDARVAHVAARADLGDHMKKCATCGADLVEGVAHTCPTPTNPPDPQPDPAPALQLSSEQLQQLVRNPEALRLLVLGQPQTPEQRPAEAQFGLTNQQITVLAQGGHLQRLLGMGGQPAPEQRPTVDPTRQPTAQVNEPAPYRFDRKGNLQKGAFDFSTDVIEGLRDRNAEALNRVQTFVSDQFKTFDTDMADAATLNPNRQRPDLYVDQKEFRYPIWNAINKGTLSDITPFVLPKFSSSSGMVAAHTEGVEPSLGTFVATSQTITPSAISGKVSITREAWDQGGNPQLSTLIWTQMVRAWYEALEASAVTLLEALSLPGALTITLATAAQDDTLVGALELELAALQFVRGGFRMEDAFGQVDLYKALVNATDADGRKLLPLITPVNAAGQAQTRYSRVNVGGVEIQPSWALAATGTVSANSYLIDRADVSGWATEPRRLTMEEIEVRYVHLGIWGYKAFACTDTTGVRRIAYDPA